MTTPPPNRMDIPTCPVAGLKLALEGQTVTRPYCRMGQDYDCRCVYCSDYAYRRACERAAEWNAATAEHRAWVAQITGALKCLALIGRAMALVASMPVAIGLFARNAADLFHEVPQKGARYRVVGSRGRAKNHQGKIGVCKWFGESDYNRRPANWRGRWVDDSKPSMTVGLSVEGEAQLVYVGFGQVERLHDTVEEIAAKLERSIVKITIAEAGVRPRWKGTVPRRPTKKNPAPMAYVVAGRDRGSFGTVCWIGSDKRTGEADARIGIKLENGYRIYASVYDCRNELPPADASVTAEERVLIERIAADAVLAEQPEKAREILAQIGK